MNLKLYRNLPNEGLVRQNRREYYPINLAIFAQICAVGLGG